jgi:hypothetical protein
MPLEDIKVRSFWQKFQHGEVQFAATNTPAAARARKRATRHQG